MVWILIGLFGFLVVVALYDVFQKKHTILRNFPIIGHLRYIVEAIGPELRQYIVTSNDEERPFSRDQRAWVYASSKQQNNYFGFGTDNDLDLAANTLIIKQATFAVPEPVKGDPAFDALHRIPCAKVIGAARGRRLAFRPRSVVSVSAMSYGSLSWAAVSAINEGCGLAQCLHNSGEGGLASFHARGGDVIWQLGTGYFGARDAQGRFSLERLLERLERFPNVRAIEIKLSQGAKPGRGGVLPGAKVTPEIAEIRGIPLGIDCISPAVHTAFSCADSMLDFVEGIAEATGLPVGIKSAVGEVDFWHHLARLMETTDRGVDYIQIDGGEGGTGAAPLVFADHVALPFKIGMSRVYRIFAERGLDKRIVWLGSGRLGFPALGLLAFGLGCDMIALAREPMLAIGCIQAMRCHSGHCPTGVATNNKWLVRGLDPTLKAARMANYMVVLRKEMMWLCNACGVEHPAQITLDHFEIVDEIYHSRSAREVFHYERGWALPTAGDIEAAVELMRHGPAAFDTL